MWLAYKVCSYSVGLSFHATPLPMQQLIWEIISLSVTARMSTCQSGKHPGGVTLCDHPPPPRKILATLNFSAPMYFRFLQPSQTSYQYKARLQKCPCLLTLTIKCKTFVCRWYTKYWKHSPSVYMYKAKWKDQHQNCIARPTFE